MYSISLTKISAHLVSLQLISHCAWQNYQSKPRKMLIHHLRWWSNMNQHFSSTLDLIQFAHHNLTSFDFNTLNLSQCHRVLKNAHWCVFCLHKHIHLLNWITSKLRKETDTRLKVVAERNMINFNSALLTSKRIDGSGA